MEIKLSAQTRQKIEKAWALFKECQKIANQGGYGGHWARLAVTKDNVEFKKVISLFPEIPIERLVGYLSEGVYWLHCAQRSFEKDPPWNYSSGEICVNNAIDCFILALEQWALDLEESAADSE